MQVYTLTPPSTGQRLLRPESVEAEAVVVSTHSAWCSRRSTWTNGIPLLGRRSAHRRRRPRCIGCSRLCWCQWRRQRWRWCHSMAHNRCSRRCTWTQVCTPTPLSTVHQLVQVVLVSVSVEAFVGCGSMAANHPVVQSAERLDAGLHIDAAVHGASAAVGCVGAGGGGGGGAAQWQQTCGAVGGALGRRSTHRLRCPQGIGCCGRRRWRLMQWWFQHTVVQSAEHLDAGLHPDAAVHNALVLDGRTTQWCSQRSTWT